MAKERGLFLCTDNFTRSQMAEEMEAGIAHHVWSLEDIAGPAA